MDYVSDLLTFHSHVTHDSESIQISAGTDVCENNIALVSNTGGGSKEISIDATSVLQAKLRILTFPSSVPFFVDICYNIKCFCKRIVKE